MTFAQTIQITMEYKERDVSDDEQIVEEDEHDNDNEDEEPVDKSELLCPTCIIVTSP